MGETLLNREETLPKIVSCWGQGRPQHPQSSVLASGDLLLMELVACLSALCFQLQSTRAGHSVAPWWSLQHALENSIQKLETSVQNDRNAPKPKCLCGSSRKRKCLPLLHSSCPSMTLPGSGSLSSTHNLPEIVCIYHSCHGV